MELSGYGICRLSVVPVRAEGADVSELISQLLFGEHYTVLESSEDGKWVYIQNAFDAYEGWIDIKQHHSISAGYFEQLDNTEYKICTDHTALILYNKNVVNVTIGAILPLLSNPLFVTEEQLAFNGEAKSIYQRWTVEQLLSIANKFLNAPYLWGGKTPFGIDCSGFTQQVFRISGYHLKRDSSQQIRQGKEIIFEERAAGDLAFFKNENGIMNHVGIILGDETIMHASGHVRIDRFDDKGIVNEALKKHTHKLFKIKRIINN